MSWPHVVRVSSVFTEIELGKVEVPQATSFGRRHSCLSWLFQSPEPIGVVCAISAEVFVVLLVEPDL